MELKDLKAGDEVIITEPWHKSIGVIDRVTKTQIVIGERKYNRKTGFEVGKYSSSHISAYCNKISCNLDI